MDAETPKTYYRRALMALQPDVPKFSPHTARIVRQHLERVAKVIEKLPGSKPYCIAYRHAAEVIRMHKPD